MMYLLCSVHSLLSWRRMVVLPYTQARAYRRRPKETTRLWRHIYPRSLCTIPTPILLGFKQVSHPNPKMPDTDATPLLPGGPYISNPAKRTRILTSILVPLLLIGAVIFVSIRGDGVPKDPLGRAKHFMDTYVFVLLKWETDGKGKGY
jgi:hypothetical protein